MRWGSHNYRLKNIGSLIQQAPHNLSQVEEDIKKFTTAVNAKHNVLVSWLSQLEGPTAERVAKLLVKTLDRLKI